jgi:hypothetical protein
MFQVGRLVIRELTEVMLTFLVGSVLILLIVRDVGSFLAAS